MTSCNVCRSFNTVMNNQLLNNERKEIGTTFNDKNIKQMYFCSAVFSASKAVTKVSDYLSIGHLAQSILAS